MAEVIEFFHEIDNTAYSVAGAEAAPRLPIRKHVERRCLFLMERTGGFETIAGTLQRHSPTYKLGDVYNQIEVIL
jgi:hypothetical protein|tara:strand:- start:89 stop:313 length:225 start_codon:yes stop_codon:yes gene_type:complete